MTITTQVRINHPISAPALLDHVTRVAGGDPDTVLRRTFSVGDDSYGEPRTTHGIYNLAAQGLKTLAGVQWAEQDIQDPDWPAPPACVILSIDNPYGFSTRESGRSVQANEILPAVVEYLDSLSVPRSAWHWEDETAGTWHPGTVPVRFLNTDDERETWTAEVSA